jgi:hypothetical protein
MARQSDQSSFLQLIVSAREKLNVDYLVIFDTIL